MYPDGGLRVRTVQHHVLVGPTSERQNDMYHISNYIHSVEFEERYETVHFISSCIPVILCPMTKRLAYIHSFVNLDP